ncbi:MAG: hypothetical protein M1434_06130 [Chloroflexi bacterium]|nr:hypothetical protein [Chloroflexota bacterium]MCL5274312.1 hypothetical protein [Chloroflexota bacterium]
MSTSKPRIVITGCKGDVSHFAFDYARSQGADVLGFIPEFSCRTQPDA